LSDRIAKRTGSCGQGRGRGCGTKLGSDARCRDPRQAVFLLYLGISFAPNHKAMPIIESATAAGFARRQVVTARNITGGRFTTFLHGGLNYQIEHHLFPSMHRPNLRRVQALVRDFCTTTDLGYSEESFNESFRQIIHHLSDAGAATRRHPDVQVLATTPGSGR
jgi:fatty acid desaturase